MPILVFLILAGAAYAAASAWDHSRGHYARSKTAAVSKAKAASPKPLKRGQERAVIRHHRTGWWAREVSGGFPVVRTGWHAGWLAHRNALAQRRGLREEARTTQLETRASVASGLREHRQRQREAQAIIDQALINDGQEAGGKKAVQEAMGKVLPFRRREPAPGDPAAPDPSLSDAQRERDEQGLREVCAACGKPSRAGEPLIIREGFRIHESHVRDPRSGYYEKAEGTQEAAASPATEGTPVATQTDANYTESLRQARQIEQEADEEANHARWAKWGHQVDALGALLHGDSASLSDAAELADAMRAQQKAAQQTAEAAAAFASGLQRRHGGIKEAHDDAPVRAAASEFYED